ncbi:GNAT family N-acetyltransferase [Streptomyces sp. NPDC021020]|uniref:GNAT family N-acetyltransferase n=1 Tax=Streptomyces sp. NPDC021020 TaxID=3365109 RepID=UPI0037B091A1
MDATQVQQFAVANLRRRPAAAEVGGFVAGFDPGTDSPYVNYATPLPGAEPSAREVAALVAAFRERGLLPRLEFAPEAAPVVATALRAAGFRTEAVHDYLVCTPGTLTVPPASVRVETPSADADFAAIDAALAEAFGGEFPSSAEGAARLRRTQESGGAVRFVRLPDGTGCAGGGSCSAPAAGTAELAGLGTRPAHRGRGIGAAVTAALTSALFAQGAASVWLESSGPDAERVYARTGFRRAGTRLYVSLPDVGGVG